MYDKKTLTIRQLHIVGGIQICDTDKKNLSTNTKQVEIPNIYATRHSELITNTQ